MTDDVFEEKHQRVECLKEDAVVAFASGLLLTDGRQRIERHLDSCDRCLRLVGAAARALSLDSTIEEVPSSRRLGADPKGARIDQFELLRPLGHGGMGVVFEAFDHHTRQRVALKTVRTSRAGAFDSIRREIHALRGIRHRGVVTIRSEGSNLGVPFYTMDLVEGPSLAAVMATLRPGRPPTDFLTVLRKVCSTLAFLHGEGIVHRDLTPRNILLREPEVPVLVDFGLASHFSGAAGREMLDAGGRTVGTLAYMAPEQIRGELVDARADLYSFGCILYEALAGAPPFPATTAAEIMKRHLNDEPPPPSMLAKDVPPELERLALRLLAKLPSRRIGYAAEVASCLGELDALDWEYSSRCESRSYLYRPGLAGRDDWLTSFDDLLAKCRSGTGGRIFISGESGSGKTRLLTEFATMARRSGMRVVTAQSFGIPSGEEEATPKAPPLYHLRPFLREVAEYCRHDRVLSDRLLGPRGKLLTDYEPDLASLPGQDRYASPVHLYGEAARLRLLSSLADTLATFATDKPTLLALDDLHWADDLTLEVLRSLPESFFEGNPLLLVGAYRSEEVSAALGMALRASPKPPLRVESLGKEAVVAMTSDMLGIPTVPSSLTESLTVQSEGNPFFVTEFLRMAVGERQLIRTQQGQWVVTEVEDNPSSALRMPSSVKQLIDRRLGILSASALSLAQLASVLGNSFSSDVLMRSAALDDASAAMDALNELVARQIIEPSNADELRFLHNKIRETVYAAIDSERRRRLHRLAAVAIEDLHGSGVLVAAAYPALAHHWGAAGNVARAISYWEKAGDRAVAIAAHGDAISYFKAALNLLSDAEIAGAAVDRCRIAHWERSLGDAYFSFGDMETSKAHLERSLTRLGFTMPDSRAGRLAFVLRALAHQIARFPFAFFDMPPNPDDVVREAALASARLAYLHVWQKDSLTATAVAFMAVMLGDRLRMKAPTARPYAQLGFTAGIARLRPLERRYFAQAREIAARLDNMSELGLSYCTEAYLRAGEGRFGEAERLSHAALRVLPNDDRLEREMTLTVMGFIARYLGKYEEGLHYTQLIRESAKAHGNAEHEIHGSILSALCLLRLDRCEEAMQSLHRAMELLKTNPEWICDMRASAQLAHGHLIRSNFAQAEKLADHALGIMRGSHGPPLLASAFDGVISMTHVYLSLWERFPPSAAGSALVSRANEALELSRKLARIFPIGRPSHLICQARFDRLLGRHRNARRSLTRAQRIASRLGMPLDPKIRASTSGRPGMQLFD